MNGLHHFLFIGVIKQVTLCSCLAHLTNCLFSIMHRQGDHLSLWELLPNNAGIFYLHSANDAILSNRLRNRQRCNNCPICISLLPLR